MLFYTSGLFFIHTCILTHSIWKKMKAVVINISVVTTHITGLVGKVENKTTENSHLTLWNLSSVQRSVVFVDSLCWFCNTTVHSEQTLALIQTLNILAAFIFDIFFNICFQKTSASNSHMQIKTMHTIDTYLNISLPCISPRDAVIW